MGDTASPKGWRKILEDTYKEPCEIKGNEGLRNDMKIEKISQSVCKMKESLKISRETKINEKICKMREASKVGRLCSLENKVNILTILNIAMILIGIVAIIIYFCRKN